MSETGKEDVMMEASNVGVKQLEDRKKSQTPRKAGSLLKVDKARVLIVPWHLQKELSFAEP